ncbi:glycosyltransferase [uncultured Aeromicrobium sp.]|uniref:glycosyltransferase n=1 Tax=uncultured Aeromicrobium sp. TaxID=337820 RepID=UPI0025F57B13|nr:glycosyltransferase [uncultured Aeromicrobium sp.]
MSELERVIVFPGWRDNPYINVMYLATAAAGAEILYPTRLTSFLHALERSGAETVAHVHWTAPVCQQTGSANQAWEQLRRFESAIEGFQVRQGRVVWTVHNRLPHELAYREPEIELCQFLANTADVVHVMMPGTDEIVAEDYRIPPEKIVQISHPSYQGLYGARDSERAQWREALGVPCDRRSVLFFGQMRPYKGLDVLLEAYRVLEARNSELPVLLLAGSTPEGIEAYITEALPASVTAVRAHRFIPDSEVEMWFGAADLAVYPYHSILNSGSVHLAATMAVPAVLPGEDHLRSQFAGEPWIRFYNPRQAASSLAQVLADPSSYERPVRAMRKFSDRLSPWTISRELAKLLTTI